MPPRDRSYLQAGCFAPRPTPTSYRLSLGGTRSSDDASGIRKWPGFKGHRRSGRKPALGRFARHPSAGIDAWLDVTRSKSINLVAAPDVPIGATPRIEQARKSVAEGPPRHHSSTPWGNLENVGGCRSHTFPMIALPPMMARSLARDPARG